MKPFTEAWYPPSQQLHEYVAVEVEAIAIDGDGCIRVDRDDDADFFGVYLRSVEGTAECVADLRTRHRAEALANLLTLGTQQADGRENGLRL